MPAASSVVRAEAGRHQQAHRERISHAGREIRSFDRIMAVDVSAVFTIVPEYYGPGREASWNLDVGLHALTAWAGFDLGVTPRSKRRRHE
jgi:hypothetical protein